jgi:hypothetical protein
MLRCQESDAGIGSRSGAPRTPASVYPANAPEGSDSRWRSVEPRRAACAAGPSPESNRAKRPRWSAGCTPDEKREPTPRQCGADLLWRAARSTRSGKLPPCARPQRGVPAWQGPGERQQVPCKCSASGPPIQRKPGAPRSRRSPGTLPTLPPESGLRPSQPRVFIRPPLPALGAARQRYQQYPPSRGRDELDPESLLRWVSSLPSRPCPGKLLHKRSLGRRSMSSLCPRERRRARGAK